MSAVTAATPLATVGPPPTVRERRLVRPGDVAPAVVSPSGVLDERSLPELDQLVRDASPSAVVIDMTDCVVISRVSAAALDVSRWDRAPGEVCIVCRRLSGRRLMSHLGVALPVFGSVQDALQARVLGAAGYGRGWR